MSDTSGKDDDTTLVVAEELGQSIRVRLVPTASMPALTVTRVPAHCRSPATCSVCLGVPARRVDIADGSVTVDGVPTRTVEPGPSQEQQNYARRGQRRGRGRR